MKGTLSFFNLYVPYCWPTRMELNDEFQFIYTWPSQCFDHVTTIRFSVQEPSIDNRTPPVWGDQHTTLGKGWGVIQEHTSTIFRSSHDPTKYPSFRPKNGPPKSIVRTQKTFESGPENFHTPVVNLDLKQYAITAQFPRSPAECRSNKISNFFGLEGRTWHIDWLGPVEVRRLCVCLSDGIGWVIRLTHMSDGSHYSQWRINVTHHPTTATTRRYSSGLVLEGSCRVSRCGLQVWVEIFLWSVYSICRKYLLGQIVMLCLGGQDFSLEEECILFRYL